MRYTGLFISLLSFVCAALPHVMRYDVVRLRPQALKERARRSIYPEQLEYDLAVDGRNFTISLHKNRELLGKHYTLSHYTKDGISETKSSDNIDHCYYQGHIHHFEESSVSLYRPLNIRVRLVGLEIWSNRNLIDVSNIPNLTLRRFLQWRQDSLLKRKKHDNAHFVTAVDFEGTTVGLASVNAMCSPSSGAVNEDHNKNPIAVASTIAHEMGHNLGMSHDDSNCACSSDKGCVMSDTIGYVYPDSFSTCSQSSLKEFLQSYDTSCLLDVPNEGELYGGPVCGNAFVEKGEECDCGTVEECNNPCCNATTCRLTESAHCAYGECCHNCQLKHSDSLCRKSAHDCDLDEYCTGESAFCPEDEYKMNGLPCNYNQGYCYNGQCPTHKEHCKMLWGSDAEVDADTCFRYNVFDRTSKSAEHMMCGKIYCYGGNPFPITNTKSTVTIHSRTCYIAVDSSPTDDLGMVPAGTKCGINKVCYHNLCQDISIYGTEDCSDKCNNRGVICDNWCDCICSRSWIDHYYWSTCVGSVMQLTIMNYQFLLSFQLLSLKDIRTSSGQCNPAFQPGSAKNSPRFTQSRISQPTFLESSTTLACKPLYSPATPSRPAPMVKSFI
uniref:ADAM metallopeptidase domain 8a n=1 Tax=Sinocyclocheilus grahami TaxID=75366 RepID=A0A672JW38_SINGR